MRFLALLAAAVFASTPARADITTGLVGHWPFDGDALDASGNGNHGTVLGATLTADRFGTPDAAFFFDGVSSRIDVPSSSSLESPTTALTMAAWIRRDGWGTVGNQYNPILTKSLSAPNAFQYRFIITPSGLGTALNNWNTNVAAPSTYDEGIWYHVASTWDGTTVRSYVNGSAITSHALSTTISQNSLTLSIGSDVPGILEIFLGALDDIRIYNRALSNSDIAELAGVPTPAPWLPGSVQVGDPYPNPVQATTILPLQMSTGTQISLEVVDARGRRVRTLRSNWFAPGRHVVPWDGRDHTGRSVASGVYFYRILAPGVEISRKAVVLK